MPKPRIRALAVCLCEDRGRILVQHGRDHVKGTAFFRAIGGGIRFGERAEAGVRREWREELGAELDDLRFFGVVENLFTYEGELGHEIVFVFAARLRDADRYANDPLRIFEDDGEPRLATWVPIEGLAGGQPPLYPGGVLQLLRRAEQ